MAPRSLAVLALVAALVAGCGRVTAENYAQVEAGMMRHDVHRLLGQPDAVSGGGIGGFAIETETWRGREHTVVVTFAGDKVAMKSIKSTRE